jgi:hypothetical protein
LTGTNKLDARRALWSALYLLLLMLLSRTVSLPLLGGGLLGFLFVPVIKVLTKQEGAGVLESVLFQVPLALVSLYAAAGLSSNFGRGFVLTIFLQTILVQLGQWRESGQIDSWFWPIKGGVSRRVSVIYFVVVLALFLLATLLLV